MSALKGLRGRFLAASMNVDASNPEAGQANSSTSTKSLERASKNRSAPEKKVQFRLGAYIRLSPSDEVRDEGSLVSHPQRIKGFVDYRNQQNPGWGEIVEWYTDKDLSGKDLNRPALKRMLHDLMQGHINAVIVTELSRLSRDVKDFCQIWEFFKKHRATFVSLKENFDTSTPIGEMMVINCISFSQFERKTIVQRIKDGARARAERGLANGSQRVLGYDPDPIKRCYLVVNESEAVVVRHCFEKFLELGSVRKLRDYLNESGNKTKQYVTREARMVGGNRWTESSIFKFLTNLALIGMREINKKNINVDPEELDEKDRYKAVKASWPPIVGDALFWKVQEVLEANRKLFKHHKHIYRLTGLVHCGICGDLLGGKSATGKNGKYFYYGHNRKFLIAGDVHTKRCPLERVPAPRLEEAVIGRLLELAKDKQLMAELARNSVRKDTKSRADLDTLIATREQERRNVQRMIDNLLGVLAEQTDAPKSVLAKVAECEGHREKISASIATLKAEKAGQQDQVIDLEEAFRLFREFRKDFVTRSAQKQRDILNDVIHRIVIQEDGARVQYFTTSQEDLLGEIAQDLVLSGEQKEKSPAEHRSESKSRTGVRLAFNLVDPGGVEPPSESFSQGGLHA